MTVDIDSFSPNLGVQTKRKSMKGGMKSNSIQRSSWQTLSALSLDKRWSLRSHVIEQLLVLNINAGRFG